MLALAKGISGRRSFVTLASVVRANGTVLDRQTLQDALVRTGTGLDLELTPHLHVAEDVWTGISEVVRSYGFGPVVPNTILFGFPEGGHLTAIAGAIRTAVRERRNVLIVRAAERPPAEGRLDVWWRGGGDNGALMLSLAVLLRRDDDWKRLTPRVNMLIRSRTVAEAEKQLADFLRRARITSETRILDTEGLPFTHALASNSADAALSLIGLRPPEDDESDAAYGDYLGHLAYDLANVPSPVFVLAAPGQDLIRIFS